jgi:hypothetical protein
VAAPFHTSKQGRRRGQCATTVPNELARSAVRPWLPLGRPWLSVALTVPPGQGGQLALPCPTFREKTRHARGNHAGPAGHGGRDRQPAPCGPGCDQEPERSEDVSQRPEHGDADRFVCGLCRAVHQLVHPGPPGRSSAAGGERCCRIGVREGGQGRRADVRSLRDDRRRCRTRVCERGIVCQRIRLPVCPASLDGMRSVPTMQTLAGIRGFQRAYLLQLPSLSYRITAATSPCRPGCPWSRHPYRSP